MQVAESTALSIKKGFLSVPAEEGGLPLDTLISNLCEHAYEHRLMHKYHVKWRVTSVVIRWMFFLSTGTSGGYSQWVGTLDGEVKRGHHILCKSVAAMPYLNRPHKRRSWRRWLWWWAEPAVDKDILSYPAPSKVDGRVVTFVDGRTFEADVIVQATGYSQRFPFLHGGENGGAKQPESEGEKKTNGKSGAKQTNGKSEALPSTVTTRKNKRKKKAPPASFCNVARGGSAGDGGTDAGRAGGGAGGSSAPGPTHQGVRGDEDALPPDHFITRTPTRRSRSSGLCGPMWARSLR